MQNALINVNGQISKPEDARIGIYDRGYLYGDSLYEVARTYNGKFLFLEEHLDRLFNSAELCRMTLAQTKEQYYNEIYRTLETFRAQSGYKGEAYCRIIVSRGEGRIGFSQKCLTTPSLYTIIIQPFDPPADSEFEKGLSLAVVPRLRNDRRALDPAMKSGNYLNNVLAFLEAEADSFDDALLCDAQGYITEGTTFNIFYVHRGILITPSLDVGILEGITRRHILEIARRTGIETRETLFAKERLYEADEVFATGSVKEIKGVTKVDTHTIGNGKIGPITWKIFTEYRKEIQKATT